MNKQEIFEYCLYLTISRFKYKSRSEYLENKYEDAQHDDDLIDATVGDFMAAMRRLGLIEKPEIDEIVNE